MDVAETHSAQLCYAFKAVRPGQISARRGEKVMVLSVKDGKAMVQKETGQRGEIPAYFLEMDSLPGRTFADQIEYRREWYQRMDGRGTSVEPGPDKNARTLLSNVGSLPDLASFMPVTPSTSNLHIESDRRPLCTQNLDDVTVKAHSTLVLSCAFHSSQPYSLTWRGVAISRKAAFEVKNGDDGESILILPDCSAIDSGQYWVEARNDAGKSDTVAWITIVDAPDAPPSILCDSVHGAGLEIRWSQPHKGCAKYVWYIVEYKCQGMNGYEVAADGVPSCSVVISDLKLKQYSFRVRAFNELFQGAASDSLCVTPSIELIRSAARAAFRDEYNKQVKYLDEKFYQYYTVDKVVARGRYSLVKSAVCKSSQRRFAVKVLTRHTTLGVDLDCENIEREIRTLHALRHSNIVSLRAAVKTEHDFIIVMKWINGPPILQYVIHLGYLSEHLVRSLFADAFAALDYMHTFNIAHLDLKPEDLVVHLSKHGARLVLVDLGSSLCCESKDRTVTFMPTEFASPEQHLHKTPSTKSDIWSLGIICYLVACGHMPFDDTHEELMKLSIISSDIRLEDEDTLGSFSEQFKHLISSILVWNPSDRPTASECLQSTWMSTDVSEEYILIDYLQDFVERRESQLDACCLHENVP